MCLKRNNHYTSNIKTAIESKCPNDSEKKKLFLKSASENALQ